MHDLEWTAFELPTVEEFFAGDSRDLVFQVTDDNGDPVDISGATVEWALYEREYHDDPADALLTGDDASVEIVTDNRVDLTNGEWEVRLDPEATEGEWGEYYHRPVVTDVEGNRASWRGEIILTV